MKTTLLSAAVFMLFAAGAARAEEGARPCKADIEKFCKDVKPGEGRIIDCLKAHEAELSADCKAKGAELKGGPGGKKGEGKGEGRGMGPMGGACKADFEKFCKDAGREKMGCMKEHEKDLSEGCKTQMAKMKDEFIKKNPCFAETQKLCPGMKPGDGKFGPCMDEHEKDLSDTCKADFAKRKGEMVKNHPCMADMEKFCKDMKPGDGKLMDCMKTHEADLSAGCKAETAKRKEGMRKNNPCAADMEKFCKDVKPGEGRIIACLKTHEAELSDTCKARQAGGMGRLGKGGEGRRGGMGRGNSGDMPGDKPAPAGVPETSPEPGTK